MTMTKKSMVFGGTAVTLVGAGVGMMAVPSVAGAETFSQQGNNGQPLEAALYEGSTSNNYKGDMLNYSGASSTGQVCIDAINTPSGPTILGYECGPAGTAVAPGGFASTPVLDASSYASEANEFQVNWKVNGSVVSQYQLLIP